MFIRNLPSDAVSRPLEVLAVLCQNHDSFIVTVGRKSKRPCEARYHANVGLTRTSDQTATSKSPTLPRASGCSRSRDQRPTSSSWPKRSSFIWQTALFVCQTSLFVWQGASFVCQTSYLAWKRSFFVWKTSWSIRTTTLVAWKTTAFVWNSTCAEWKRSWNGWKTTWEAWKRVVVRRDDQMIQMDHDVGSDEKGRRPSGKGRRRLVQGRLPNEIRRLPNVAGRLPSGRRPFARQ